MSVGLTLILYSPVTGSDFCARLKLALLELADVRVVPSVLSGFPYLIRFVSYRLWIPIHARILSA